MPKALKESQKTSYDKIQAYKKARRLGGYDKIRAYKKARRLGGYDKIQDCHCFYLYRPNGLTTPSIKILTSITSTPFFD